MGCGGQRKNIVSLLSEAPYPGSSRWLDAGINEMMFFFTPVIAAFLAVFYVHDHGWLPYNWTEKGLRRCIFCTVIKTSIVLGKIYMHKIFNSLSSLTARQDVVVLVISSEKTFFSGVLDEWVASVQPISTWIERLLSSEWESFTSGGG